ncbi:MAG: hypothetical protein ACYCX4_09585 [Bacillota bacterium]
MVDLAIYGRKTRFWVALVLILAALWFFRTWWHSPLLLLYTHPVIFYIALIWWLLHQYVLSRLNCLKKERIMRYKDSKGMEKNRNYRLLGSVSLVILIILFVAGLVLAGWARATGLASSLKYVPVDHLPESRENIRLMPAEVATRYAKDSLQLSQYHLGTRSIVKIGSNLSWIFPLTPDGLIITFTKKNKGIIYIDATTQAKNSSMVWKDMNIGEGMRLTHNLWWNLYRKHYFLTTEYPFYITDKEEIYTVVPAVSYAYRFALGVPYTIPKFAGLYLANTAGTVSFLTPEEAQQFPALHGNRIFPEALARTYISAFQYRQGVLNKLFIHQDQIQIQDVERETGEVNRQPYLMDTEKGLQWFISTEPFGQSHGVFKIFLVDAVTGDISLYQLPEEQTLTGPVRAVDYVRKSNPIVDWSNFELVEPLPFIRSGELYWKLAVIPMDAAGIAYQAFLDSRTNEVSEFSTDADIRAFATGKSVTAPKAGEKTGAGLIQQIKDKMKELDGLIKQLEAGSN